jgi:glutamyl-tRNA reductase
MNTQPTDLKPKTSSLNINVLDDLPLLTEVAAEDAHEKPAAEEALPRTFSREEMQQVLQKLEAHMETVFISKLNTQLEQLQRLAIDLAVSEFKAELPHLLRDALNDVNPEKTA